MTSRFTLSYGDPLAPACFQRYVLLIGLVPVLCGCAPLLSALRDDSAPNAGVVDESTIPERWCYKTLGGIDCYVGPQDFPPELLVSVDPVSRLPASREAYVKALAASRASNN